MRAVEEKEPSYSEIIQQLHLAEHELKMLDRDEKTIAQLSLTIQLYYLNGASDESKQKALDIIDRFKQQYPLKTHFPYSHRGFVKLTEKSYQSAYKKAKDQNVMEWFLSSSESSELSGDYAVGVYTARDNVGASHIQFNFPISMVFENKGRQEFHTWIEYLVENFEVLHGYAGLSIQLPYARHPFQFYEYGVTRQYWGITPDGASFLTLDWEEGIRSINWYTLIGKNFRERLQTQLYFDEILRNSKNTELKEVNNCLILKAEALPRLGDKSKSLPLSYVVINQLCQPIRTEVPTDAMHTVYRGPRYSLSQVYYWIHRWDNANFIDGDFDPEGKKENLLPILGEYGNDDRSVPYSGIWTPFDFEGIDQHFTLGEEFPERGQYQRKSGTISTKPVVWKLVKRDDHQATLLPNPF